MLLIIFLLFCWNLRNSITTASLQTSEGRYSQSSNFPSIQFHYPQTVSSRPNKHELQQHHGHYHPSQSQSGPGPGLIEMLPLAGAIALADDDETAVRVFDPATGIKSQSTALVPFQDKSKTIFDGELLDKKKKKAYGEPSIATRSQLAASLKNRPYFAYTQDEVDEKVRNDEYRQVSERRKRESQHRQILTAFQQKRTGEARASGAGAGTSTGGRGRPNDNSPLPWACETKYEWKDMGVNHYPRFVRTAECSGTCFMGFFLCRPRRYKTKVLQRIVPNGSESSEDVEDVSLPASLRPGWKFVTVTINLCCDCNGRIPNSPTPDLANLLI